VRRLAENPFQRQLEEARREWKAKKEIAGFKRNRTLKKYVQKRSARIGGRWLCHRITPCRQKARQASGDESVSLPESNGWHMARQVEYDEGRHFLSGGKHTNS